MMSKLGFVRPVLVTLAMSSVVMIITRAVLKEIMNDPYGWEELDASDYENIASIVDEYGLSRELEMSLEDGKITHSEYGWLLDRKEYIKKQRHIESLKSSYQPVE